MNVLTFCAENQFTALFLSIPTMLVLCCFSWSFATVVTSVWSTLINGITTCGALLVALIWGYPTEKVTVEEVVGKPEVGPDSAQDEGSNRS